MLDNQIEASFSNFGKIPYGYTTVGQLYLDPVHPDKDYACKDLDSIKVTPSFDLDVAIILVDRYNILNKYNPFI